ncbi:MAG TPA: membrane protein insertase YidC [Candidatus Sulfotelmatobacter sp.]|nr:membrane protein insertase YidC [Candidatus Sulfotelmatobacter sp.]
MAEYQNPQHEPGSEKRLLLIFLVTFVIMLAFQPLLKRFLPTPPAPQQQPTQSVPAQPAPPPAAAISTSGTAPAASPRAGVTKQAAGETETVLENDLYRITFTNRGAQVKSWILKKYDNEAENGPLDLVNPAAASQFGYPLSLWTYDADLRGKLSSALYVASQEGKQSTPATISFEYADQDLFVRKTFSFDNTYIVNVDTSVTYKGNWVAALPAWPAAFGDQVTPAFYGAGMIDYQFNKNIERLPVKKVSGGGTIQGPLHWAGPSDLYFAAVFIPDDPASAALVTLRNSLSILSDPQKSSSEKTTVEVLGAAVGNLKGPTSERVFVGPKELEILQKVPVPGVVGADNDLNGLVDFGWWGIIAKPLFLWLKWTYHHVVSNWGWAIVIQTLIISVALLPLRITQMKSMLKMQRVAPQIKAIQEKYKKYSLRDPRKAQMNEEISAIYKREGVNPAGGCLPMLIQFPFLIAYYRMLGAAIDLRHAHWLWIHDLSAAEPFPYILPIIMVVSMLVVQKMTPQAGMDPTQQKMMTVMMPLMMGFIFFRLAAGLNLYYAEANLISIAQQAVMNRTSLGQEMREMMAKRARKKEK